MLSRRSLLLGAFAAAAEAEMAILPGGRHRMGADEDTLLRQFPDAGAGLKSMLLAETPAHDVILPPFRMDRYEVTNAQYRRFVRSVPRWRKERVGGDYLKHWDGDLYPGAGAAAAHPVAYVTWDAAAAYAEWADKRLPTEAEWEFAARGGRAEARYPWGNDDDAPPLANYAASGRHTTAPVGSYPPNPYGLYDLAGNVWELCLDPWTRYAARTETPSPADLARMRVADAERRVIRGGSYDGSAFNLRVTARDSHRAAHPVPYVGFRCARGE